MDRVTEHVEQERRRKETLAKMERLGSRAKIVLEELDGFFKKLDEMTLAQLSRCSGSDEAYHTALAYQATLRAHATFESAVIQANEASAKLEEMEE